MSVSSFNTNIFGEKGKFDDPFLLPSSDYIPDNLEGALDFCLFLYYLNPQYRRASARVIRHFITDFDTPGEGSAAEKDALREYLTYDLRAPQAMAEMGDEWSCYGNAFYRIHYPFDRYLVDRRHDCEYSVDWFGSTAKFNLKEFVYEVPDPKNTSKTIKLPFRDRMALDKSRIKLRKLDPRQMVIDHNFISGTSRYIYKFEPELIKGVNDSNLTIINEIPVDMLKAMRNDQDFLFYQDEIFHFKAPTISGISNEGWGLPETLANYRSLHLLQVYRKIDESIGLDYMVPFRLFSPETSTNESAVVKDLILHRWKSEITTIVNNRRKDKFAIHALPFPVNYQEFGAGGKSLTPKDLIEYQTDSMLDAMGYPAELFRGSLKVEQIPTAVRLFENSFMFVHLNFTQFLQWVVHRISMYMGEPELEIQLQRPSMADNLDRQNILLQLSSGGEISRAKAYSSLGIDDPLEEQRTRADEDAEIQKMKMKKQQELERELLSGSIDDQLDMESQQAAESQSGMGANVAGGQPGQSVGGGVTPMDAESQAQEKAQMWLSMPDGDKRRDMMSTKTSNPNLYSRAKQLMEEIRSQAKSDGLNQMNQQAQGGG